MSLQLIIKYSTIIKNIPLFSFHRRAIDIRSPQFPCLLNANSNIYRIDF